MHNREFEQFEIPRGLKLWYVYNKRAIQQSHDLCRVVTSHRLTMTQPQVELDRIFDELHNCGVNVPNKATKEDIESFIDIKLQHGTLTLKDTSCEENLDNLQPPASWKPSSDADLQLYRVCMKAYCAMEDGSAYRTNFEWDESIKDN